MIVTASNNRFATGFLIVYMAVGLLMIFFPIHIHSSGINFYERLYSLNYPAFFIRIIVEVAYCGIFLYIVALLKFIGTKKFVLAAFYILLAVQVGYFATFIYGFLWPGFIGLYSFLFFLSTASILYLVVASFWIKDPIVGIPFRIYSFSLIFMDIVQQLYLRLVVATTMPFGKPNPYEHVVGLLSYIPDCILLYIIVKANLIIAQKENDNALTTDI